MLAWNIFQRSLPLNPYCHLQTEYVGLPTIFMPVGRFLDFSIEQGTTKKKLKYFPLKKNYLGGTRAI
jgi:hypothetical protein